MPAEVQTRPSTGQPWSVRQERQAQEQAAKRATEGNTNHRERIPQSVGKEQRPPRLQAGRHKPAVSFRFEALIHLDE